MQKVRLSLCPVPVMVKPLQQAPYRLGQAPQER